MAAKDNPVDILMRSGLRATIKVERLKEHANAFGFLRLVLAALVIVSHTPEMADGNRDREILTRAFGGISFGEIAVDGFFLISGYLIVGSFAKRPDVVAYLVRRVARIYPAFIVASLICLLIVAPLAGARMSEIVNDMPISVWHMAKLQMPMAANVFAGTNYAQLDSSMWTIRYEFLCYLIVIPLGLFGFLNKPAMIGIISICCLILFSVITFNGQLDIHNRSYFVAEIPHALNKIIKFAGVFLTGSLFFLYRDRIRFTTVGIAVAVVGVCALLFIPSLAELGVATFGAYLIFAIASRGGSGILARINNRNDISYGVYLYAWPAEKLLMWYWPEISLLAAGFCTLVISCACGWISWHALEKPAIAILIGNRFK